MLAPSGLVPFIAIALALEPTFLPPDPDTPGVSQALALPACPEEADPSIAADALEVVPECDLALLEAGIELGDPGFVDLALTGARLGDAGAGLPDLALGPSASPWRARLSRWLPSLAIGVMVQRRDPGGHSAQVWLRLFWTLEDA